MRKKLSPRQSPAMGLAGSVISIALAALAHRRPLLVGEALQRRESAGAFEPAAAVDDHRLAVDIGAVVGDEKGGKIAQLLVAAGAAERVVGAVLLGAHVAGHKAGAGA